MTTTMRDFKKFCQRVVAAVQRSREENQKAEDEHRWISPLWEFTRHMKGDRSLKSLAAWDALTRVELALREIVPREGGYEDVWYSCFGQEAADSQAEFVHCWDEVRLLPDSTPMQSALAMAEAYPVKMPEGSCPLPDYRSLITLAVHLQLTVRDGNIFLPCELLAEQLNVSAMTISRFRRMAVKEGLIIEISASEFRSNGQSRATEFRVNRAKFPELFSEGKTETSGSHTEASHVTEDVSSIIWE